MRRRSFKTCDCSSARSLKSSRDEEAITLRYIDPRGYEFDVAASLVRDFRLPPARAERLVFKWRRLVDGRRRENKSAKSTAEHLDRFERQHLLQPYRRDIDVKTRGRRWKANTSLKTTDREKAKAIWSKLSSDEKTWVRQKIGPRLMR